MSGHLLLTGEGHGDLKALESLAARALKAQGHGGSFSSFEARRFNLYSPGKLELACEYARSVRPGALLVTSDSEDSCPQRDAPRMAAEVRALGLPFPAAVVLFHREFETIFVSVADRLAGMTIQTPRGESIRLAAPVIAPEAPERRRDAKGWVSELLLNGAPYKPRLHQLPLTRAAQPQDLRAAGLSSYRRFERAIDHLARSLSDGSRGVYPA